MPYVTEPPDDRPRAAPADYQFQGSPVSAVATYDTSGRTFVLVGLEGQGL